jgi:hypothetical protein
MADFKKQGGVLTGREERFDGFEGEPRSVGGALGAGEAALATGTTGHHHGHHEHGHHSSSTTGTSGLTSGTTGTSGLGSSTSRDYDNTSSSGYGNTSSSGYGNSSSTSKTGQAKEAAADAKEEKREGGGLLAQAKAAITGHSSAEKHSTSDSSRY